MGLAFALIALAYTFFARQEWSATAITDRPTVNMLGGYYSQQQFLRNLDARSNMASADQPSVMDEAYKVVMQLASWDTRRKNYGCKPTITSSGWWATAKPMRRCWMK